MTSTSQFQNANLLPEEDLLNVILADLKRTVREYTTATTESACPSVRQMFTQLTDSTLQLQGQLFQLLSSQNMYTAPSKATRTEVDKKLQEAQQTQQQLPAIYAAAHRANEQRQPGAASQYAAKCRKPYLQLITRF